MDRWMISLLGKRGIPAWELLSVYIESVKERMDGGRGGSLGQVMRRGQC